ncbi:LysR family transcriptional regulator [Halomonas kalidii]|uniref:LysR substrate-binding domain-containing protein n=1 Tax=Halomonas kalidii TaxID=3043293 RepID=A0ABT6VHB4_9GAMM|nr:LysR substrate-binding domain-containing protein [Halomonas kalidii]MDI5932388.1 LysR substrate-binding domain-containing protein [Halomonas kalidii]
MIAPGEIPTSARSAAPAEAMDSLPSLRCLRALATVAERGSVLAAAEALNLSQPAVSRAIRDLEKTLDLSLFERHHGGMLCTEAGELVTHRCRRVLHQFARAERQLAQLPLGGHFHRLAQRLSLRHLRVLVTLAETRNERQAARRLALTQPTVSASLRDLEGRVGTPLFLRTQRGLIATPGGTLLSRHAKVALREMALLQDDIAAWRGEARGRVIIGALPLTSSLLVPRAVDTLLRERPGLAVTVHEGTYDVLFEALRSGEIDALVGVLHRIDPEEEMTQQVLLHDRLVAVARPGHPLMGHSDLALEALLDWPWIAPPRGTPARHSFDQQFNTLGITPPTPVVEAGNLGVIRALLRDSDRLALVSPYQVHYEVQDGHLAYLPLRLQGPPRAIGLTMREDSAPSPALSALRDTLLTVSRALPSSP